LSVDFIPLIGTFKTALNDSYSECFQTCVRVLQLAFTVSVSAIFQLLGFAKTGPA